MKIAVISDMHLGYARFEEDSFIQAENAFLDANEKADLIICAGDIFDAKIPKLEAIKRAADIFRKMKIPVFAVHGNHERRSKDMVNPVHLLATMGAVRYLHGKGEIFLKNGERLFVFGIGSVPEELASAAIKKSLEDTRIPKDAFRILVLHQSVSDFVAIDNLNITLEELEGLPFDLIINGHMHERKLELNEKLLMPGSTVITQLKEEETAPRGYMIFDTTNKKSEFVEIKQRKFFFEKIMLRDAGIAETKNAIYEMIKRLREKDSNAIIKIKLGGSLRDGMNPNDFGSISIDDKFVFIDNELGAGNMKERIERIKKSKDDKLSVREIALKELEKEVAGKVTLFKPHELFEKLCIGIEEAENYLKSNRGSSA